MIKSKLNYVLTRLQFLFAILIRLIAPDLHSTQSLEMKISVCPSVEYEIEYKILLLTKLLGS